MPETKKEYLLREAISSLERTIERTKTAFESARTDVVQAEGRMKTRYDSMRTESGFLADGQSQRLAEAEEELGRVRQVKLNGSYEVGRIGSLVRLCDEGTLEEKQYFLLPGGGGDKLSYEQEEVTVLTPKAPLGKMIIGKEEGEEFRFRDKTYSISEIS